MTSIDLDDNDRFLEVTYTGDDGKPYVLKVDAVEAHDHLATIGEEHPDSWEDQQTALRKWVEGFGCKAMPASYLWLLGGAIRKGYEEFKKKADPTLTSQMFTESTPSVLEQLKDGRLKLASQESSPSENSGPDAPPVNLPPTGSTD